MQPLIAPLYEGKTAHEMLALFSRSLRQEALRDCARVLAEQSGSQGPGVRSGSGRPTVSQTAARATAVRRQHSRGSAAPGTGSSDAISTSWRKWVHDGFIPNTALPAKTVAPKSDWASCASRMRAGRPRSQHQHLSNWSSAPIQRSTTAASPTTAGCRNCRSR